MKPVFILYLYERALYNLFNNRSRQQRACKHVCDRNNDRTPFVYSSNERFNIHVKIKIVYCGKQKMLIFAQSNKQNDQ